MFGAQPAPKFGSAPFYGPPFEATSGFGDPYPPPSLPRNQAGFVPAPPSQPAGVNGFPTFKANGIIPPSLGATPLATTAAAAFARGGSAPAGALADTERNPFSRFLNALNPISSASAADDEGWGFPPAVAQALAQGLIDAATARILTERAKVLQEVQDAWKDLREVAQGRASSRALARALEASGVSRPEGYDAHHIVAGGDRRAEVARDILKGFKIGINDATNGVFLPADKATLVINGETIHASLHTKDYFEAVEKALQKATTREQAVDILRRIGQALQSGNFP